MYSPTSSLVSAKRAASNKPGFSEPERTGLGRQPGAATVLGTMRMLFTCRPGYGHYYPLVPLARAAAAAGHGVAVATGEPILDLAEADGFEAFSAGLGFAAAGEAVVAAFGPLAAIPRERHRSLFFGRVFTGIELPARLPELLAIADKWRPDL